MAVVRTGRAPHQVRDIGPAAAHADGVQTIAALSRDSVLNVAGVVAQGSGPIERRLLTREELAALTARETLRALEDFSKSHPSTDQPARQAAPSRPEERPVTIAAAPPTSLERPCDRCLHEPVCALKVHIPAEAGDPVETVLAPGLRLYATGWTVACDHQLLSAIAEPVPAPLEEVAAAPRHPSKAGERAEKANRAVNALAALERHGGDATAAAKELGIRGNAFAMILKHAGRNAGTVTA